MEDKELDRKRIARLHRTCVPPQEVNRSAQETRKRNGINKVTEENLKIGDMNMFLLTQEEKDQSVEKWKEILINIQAQRVLHYNTLYWKECGFCTAANRTCQVDKDADINTCSVCPFNVLKIDEYIICDSNPEISSWVSVALEQADREDYALAEKAAQIVLDAIKDVVVCSDVEIHNGMDEEINRPQRLLDILNTIVKLPGGNNLYAEMGSVRMPEVAEETALELEERFPELGIKLSAGHYYITVASLFATITDVLCGKRLAFQVKEEGEQIITKGFQWWLPSDKAGEKS